MRTIFMSIYFMTIAISVFAADGSQVEITLQPNVPTIDSQLKILAEKDTALAALRTQAADSAAKLIAVRESVENEAFRLLNETVSAVKLRGFGPVRLVPLLDDYLVIIPLDLAKNVDTFFAKIRKRVLVGKAATYLICERRYFVPAAATPVNPGSDPQLSGRP